jgi:hypothetical protein
MQSLCQDFGALHAGCTRIDGQVATLTVSVTTFDTKSKSCAKSVGKTATMRTQASGSRVAPIMPLPVAWTQFDNRSIIYQSRGLVWRLAVIDPSIVKTSFARRMLQVCNASFEKVYFVTAGL